MKQQATPPTERPQAEPEIIPPGARVDFRSRTWASADTRARGRIYVARLGPVGSAVLFLAIGVLAVFALFLLLGAVLISLGVIGVLTIGAILSVVWRGRSQRIG
jgi:Flp pilus assembly protein TadB